MAKAIRVHTRVLPGNRVEVSTPELSVGRAVEVTVVQVAPEQPPRRSVLEFLDSLPPRHHTAEQWAQIERQFQEERDAWDR